MTFPFDKISVKQVTDFSEAIADASFMDIEFIKQKYERNSPNFADTIEFLRQSDLVTLSGSEIIPNKDYEAFLDQFKKSARPKEAVRELMLPRLLSRRSSFSNYVQEFLSNFRLRDERYEFAPTTSQNLEYSGLRNLLIDLDFLSVDPALAAYVIVFEDFLTYVEPSHSSPMSLAEFLATQRRREQIGGAAELQVIEYEKERLSRFPNLAARIEHVAVTDVSAGYDIRSFHGTLDYGGEPIARFIEVKAVSRCDYGFVWTRNEIEKSRLYRQDYYLYLLPVKGRSGFDKEGLRLIQDPFFNVYMNEDVWARTAESLSFSTCDDSDIHNPACF
jgi:hypothetical protein